MSLTGKFSAQIAVPDGLSDESASQVSPHLFSAPLLHSALQSLSRSQEMGPKQKPWTLYPGFATANLSSPWLQFYVNPCTAAGMLDVLKVPKGEWLLQSAAGSVLGRQVRLGSCHHTLCHQGFSHCLSSCSSASRSS